MVKLFLTDETLRPRRYPTIVSLEYRSCFRMSFFVTHLSYVMLHRGGKLDLLPQNQLLGEM